MKKDEEITKGLKGFDKNLKCRDFQYEIGKEYETKDKPARCTEHGFHFCENPLDVFGYYPPAENRFCEVEGVGEKSTDNSDTKIAVSKIKIGAEISLPKLIDCAVKFIFEKVKWEEKTMNTGDYSAATNTGNYSAATVSGKESIACGLGRENKAKGAKGCWLVLSEYKEKNNEWHLHSVKSVLVDGKKIKEDTFYELKNGKFIQSK